MSLITGKTYQVLSAAKIDKATLVPDDHKAFDKEQQEVTANYKVIFGCQEATSTFKLVDKDGERAIYYPSVLNKDNKVMIEWGGKYFPLPDKAKFDAANGEFYVIDGQGEDAETYTLKARIAYITPETAKTKTQKEYSLLPKDQRASYLAKAYDKGVLFHLLSEGFPNVLKLSEVKPGTYKVVQYKMNRFDKYELKLEDGTWIRSNTAICNKIEMFEEFGIAVSYDAPATLLLEPSKGKTQTGYDIYPVTLTPFKPMSVPVFDFSDPTAVDEEDSLEPPVISFVSGKAQATNNGAKAEAIPF